MPRTVTTHLQTFHRPNVTYSFSSGPEAHITTITVPPGSDWTSEPHWHVSHTEYLKVISGTALITLGQRSQSVTSDTGPVVVDRGVVHEWRRDPNNDSPLVVEEWTDPADGAKELFFRNLCSALLDITAKPSRAPPPRGMASDWYITLQLFLIFQEFDNYPVIHNGLAYKYTTYLVLRIAQFLGLIFGVKGRYNEYTLRGSLDKGKGN